MLKQGEVEVQASGSGYVLSDGYYSSTNFGGKVGVGVSEKYNLKLKYEYMIVGPSRYYFNGKEEYYENGAYSFVQIDNKIRTGKRSALSIPLGVYIGEFPGASLEPRYIITFSQNNKVDFTITPKVDLLYYFMGVPVIYPGICLNAGFSTDLDKWVVRPEIGWKGYSPGAFSFGIGFSCYLFNKKNPTP